MFVRMVNFTDAKDIDYGITYVRDVVTPVLHSPDSKGRGDWNWGSYVNKKLDQLIDAQRIESDPAKRKKLIAEALAEHNAQIHHVPLHRQVIPWAMRDNIRVIHRADNTLAMDDFALVAQFLN